MNNQLYPMNEKKHASCNWCGTTRSEKWRTSSVYWLRTDAIYCSTDCRTADDVPIFACFSVIMITLMISFLVIELTSVSPPEVFQSWVFLQVTFSILAIASVYLFLKGVSIRKTILKDSRIGE